MASIQNVPIDSVPKRTRLAGGISVVGLIGVLATLLFSGSLFWMAAPKENQQTPVVTSSDVPLTHKRIQDIQPGQWFAPYVSPGP